MRLRPAALIGEIAARDQAVVDLARVVSPAVQVEPQLLRHARLDLIPAATAATEADLWFSALVARRSPAGITLDPGVRRELRRELAGQPALLGRASRVIAEVHAGEAPVVLAEERLVALGLLAEAEERLGESGHVTVLGLGSGAHASALIEEELRALAAAMRRTTGPGFARWVARALPALPPAAGTSPAAWTLALGASMRLGGRRILQGVPPEEVTPEVVAWLLPEDGPRTEVGVRLLAGALEFAATDIPEDAQIIRPPRTDPLILGVSYLDGAEVRSRRILLPTSGTVTVPVISEGLVTIRTALGHRYTIEPERSSRTRPVIFIGGAGQSDERLQELVMEAAREVGVGTVRRDVEWPEEKYPAISAQLLSCDAAVIPVSRQALTSAWTQRDVTILMWRKSLQPDFLVLPLLARDVTFDDVVGSPLAATGLTDTQFVVEGEPERPVPQITEVLRRLSAEWRKPASHATPAPAAPAWTARLDCPNVVAAGTAFTVVIGVTQERHVDLPVLAAVGEDAEIRVDVATDGTVGEALTASSVNALAQTPFQMSLAAPPDPDRMVVVRATFSSAGTPLAVVDRGIRVVDTASADQPALYLDEAGARRLVLLNRLGTRRVIHQMMDPDSKTRILVVNGPPKSGKSFTRRIIQQTAEQTQAFQTAYVNLADLLAAEPTDLVRELLLHMGGSIDAVPAWRPDLTARSVRELAIWLAAQTRAAERDWWWILDGLSSPTLPSATRDLVHAVADEARDAPLRLVLLDFHGPLRADMSPSVYREELVPIGEPEVREFFSDLLRRRGNRADELAEIDTVTRSVLEDLPAGAGRLGALSARVSRLAAVLWADRT